MTVDASRVVAGRIAGWGESLIEQDCPRRAAPGRDETRPPLVARGFAWLPRPPRRAEGSLPACQGTGAGYAAAMARREQFADLAARGVWFRAHCFKVTDERQ